MATLHALHFESEVYFCGSVIYSGPILQQDEHKEKPVSPEADNASIVSLILGVAVICPQNSTGQGERQQHNDEEYIQK